MVSKVSINPKARTIPLLLTTYTNCAVKVRDKTLRKAVETILNTSCCLGFFEFLYSFSLPVLYNTNRQEAIMELINCNLALKHI